MFHDLHQTGIVLGCPAEKKRVSIHFGCWVYRVAGEENQEISQGSPPAPRLWRGRALLPTVADPTADVTLKGSSGDLATVSSIPGAQWHGGPSFLLTAPPSASLLLLCFPSNCFLIASAPVTRFPIVLHSCFSQENTNWTWPP